LNLKATSILGVRDYVIINGKKLNIKLVSWSYPRAETNDYDTAYCIIEVKLQKVFHLRNYLILFELTS
jgi:hypothetical protein